jgi:hypothetical protein
VKAIALAGALASILSLIIILVTLP